MQRHSKFELASAVEEALDDTLPNWPCSARHINQPFIKLYFSEEMQNLQDGAWCHNNRTPTLAIKADETGRANPTGLTTASVLTKAGRYHDASWVTRIGDDGKVSLLIDEGNLAKQLPDQKAAE